MGLVVVVVLVAAGAVLVTRAIMSSGTEDIFMEPAASVGTNPFTTIAVVQPTTTTTSTPPAPTTTALYGGSGSQQRCDPAALITFLTTHLDKGRAWIGALNADPTLRWVTTDNVIKTSLTLEDIPAFINQLTPTFLARDTRVTNHGYFNGKATPHQSILQAGTAVLVDRDGVPRARCACGNPLLPPHKVRHPHYNGPCWPGCRQDPPCTGPRCVVTTTEPTPTTVVETTTTCPPQSPAIAAVPCNPPPTTTTTEFIVRRPTGTTSPPTTFPTVTTTVQRTTIPRTTTPQRTTATTQCVPTNNGAGCGKP